METTLRMPIKLDNKIQRHLTLKRTRPPTWPELPTPQRQFKSVQIPPWIQQELCKLHLTRQFQTFHPSPMTLALSKQTRPRQSVKTPPSQQHLKATLNLQQLKIKWRNSERCKRSLSNFKICDASVTRRSRPSTSPWWSWVSSGSRLTARRLSSIRCMTKQTSRCQISPEQTRKQQQQSYNLFKTSNF